MISLKNTCLQKCLMEKDPLTDCESKLIERLQGLKKKADQIIQTLQCAKTKAL